MARKKHGAKHWQEVLKRQAESGWSVREFCAKAGISQQSFYAWRRKFRERGGLDGESPQRSDPGKEPGDGSPFIPLKLLESTGALEVIHPLGYQIRVTGDVNVHGLRQVLDLLDGRRDR
jgi:hypothetical protein